MQKQINKIERETVIHRATRKGYSAGAKRTLLREVTRSSRRHGRLVIAEAVQEIEADKDALDIEEFYNEMYDYMDADDDVHLFI